MEEKRLLFVLRGIYPNMNAASEIAYRIANILRDKYKCRITILGGDVNPSETDFPEPGGFQTFYIASFIKYREVRTKYKNRWKRRLRLFRDPRLLRFYWHLILKDPYVYSKEYRYATDDLLKNEKYDCVVCFSEPYDSLRNIYRLKSDVPVISYKLDPWSTNFRMQKNRKREEKDEHRADQKVEAIITSGLIKAEYLPDTPVEILEKIHVLNYPNVLNYGLPRKKMDLGEPECVHCVYAGSVYRDIRNPKYACEVFNKLFHGNIRLHIFGFEYGNTGLLKELPENIIYHGEMTSEEALEYMQAADVLVNIGNTITNMMPSKILTYISLGKPIVNFVKNPNCPTLPFLERYPLALNVMETEISTGDDVERVKKFVIGNKGKQVPFEEIRELYYDCTPEYVGEKVHDIICSVVEDKNNLRRKRSCLWMNHNSR